MRTNDIMHESSILNNKSNSSHIFIGVLFIITDKNWKQFLMFSIIFIKYKNNDMKNSPKKLDTVLNLISKEINYKFSSVCLEDSVFVYMLTANFNSDKHISCMIF